MPLAHFLDQPKSIIGLENACLSHSNTQNNEQTLKAFKMACLAYRPSNVTFEKTSYQRNDLIAAKQQLMQFCLSKLKHLDLESTEHIHIDPRHVPSIPSTRNDFVN